MWHFRDVGHQFGIDAGLSSFLWILRSWDIGSHVVLTFVKQVFVWEYHVPFLVMYRRSVLVIFYYTLITRFFSVCYVSYLCGASYYSWRCFVVVSVRPLLMMAIELTLVCHLVNEFSAADGETACHWRGIVIGCYGFWMIGIEVTVVIHLVNFYVAYGGTDCL